MSQPTNLDVILGIYESFRRGDIPAILSTIDPQGDLHFEGSSAIPWTGLWRGIDGWTRFFQAVGENLDEVTLAMEPFAVQGDNVVVAGRYQGRVKSTGKRIDSPLVHLWTLRNGKVVRCVEVTNTAAEAAACTAGMAAAT
jgi:ketosteroid isomerase-like protein